MRSVMRFMLCLRIGRCVRSRMKSSAFAIFAPVVVSTPTPSPKFFTSFRPENLNLKQFFLYRGVWSDKLNTSNEGRVHYGVGGVRRR